MRYAVVCVLMLSAIGCESPQSSTNSPGPLEKIHAEFRSEIVKALPADYSSVKPNEDLKEFQAIAVRVYSPHAAELRQEAMRLLAELPPFDSNALDGLVERFSGDLEPEKAAEWPVGMLYVGKAWNPTAAALVMKNITVPRLVGAGEFGARAMHRRFLPDRVYRSGGTKSEPLVAVKSLRDVFKKKLDA